MASFSSIGKNLGTYMPIGTTTVFTVLVSLVFSNETGSIDSVCDFRKGPVAASTTAMLSLIIAILGLICMLAPFVVFRYGANASYTFLLWPKAKPGKQLTTKGASPSTPAVGGLPATNSVLPGSGIANPTGGKTDLEAGTPTSAGPPPDVTLLADPVVLGPKHFARSALSVTAFLTFALLSPSSASCFFKGKIPDAVVRVLPVLVALVLAIVMGFLPAPKLGEAWPFDAPPQANILTLPPEITVALKKETDDAIEQIRKAAAAQSVVSTPGGATSSTVSNGKP